MSHSPVATAGLVLVAAAVAGLAVAPAATSAPPVEAPAWPRVTREMKPWTRWWWLGNIGSPAEFSAEMAEYARAGLGGLEITPIYGVRGREAEFVAFLSPAFLDRLDHVLREGRRLDLGMDMATGTGWPFGGPWVGPESACRNIVHRTFTLRAGARLREPVRLVQRPMVRAVGRRLTLADVREPVGSSRNLQALALEQVRFEKPLPLEVLMAYSGTGETLDLTRRIAADGRLDWEAPAGTWTLYALFQGWHGKQVERAGPGGEGDVIDHFSAAALRNYLARFDTALRGRRLEGLRAFFNDSYEVDDAAGEANWTPRLLDEFRRRRGYDLRLHLPALLDGGSGEAARRVLCDYRETFSDLLLEEFTVPWRRWAKGHGALVRNQAHGAPANVLDLYAASDIPETEGEDLLRIKAAPSAAHVTGKRLASSESATWLDEHFEGTLAQVKTVVDRYFLGGVNHIVYHGTPFSPPREPWPGFLFYAAEHFGPTSSYWPDFPSLNRYVTRCQSFLQAGQPDEDVLLYAPMHDLWAERGRRSLEHFIGGDGESLRSAASGLLDAGYTFDYVSDRQLAGAAALRGRVRTAGATYRAVVVPRVSTLPLPTMRRLVELARAGATVIVAGGVPQDVPGRFELERRRAELRSLVAGLCLRSAPGGLSQAAEAGKGRFLAGDSLPALMAAAGVPRERLGERGLRWTRRRHGADRVYFLLNGERSLAAWVPLNVEGRSVARYDPMRGSAGWAPVRRRGGGPLEVFLRLAPGENCVLKSRGSAAPGPALPDYRPQGEPRALEGRWRVEFTRGGPELPPPVEREAPGSWTTFGGEEVRRFSGTGVYTLTFPRPAGPADAWRLDLGRVAQSARITLNGRDLGTLIAPPFQIVIPAPDLRAQNSLEVAVSNLMANRIADLDRRGVSWKKFYNINFPARRRENAGPDGLFTAARWEPRDSGLLGPVTLAPLARSTPPAE